jgi:hypothetical protein
MQLYREVTDNIVAFSPNVRSDKNESGEGREKISNTGDLFILP